MATVMVRGRGYGRSWRVHASGPLSEMREVYGAMMLRLARGDDPGGVLLLDDRGRPRAECRRELGNGFRVVRPLRLAERPGDPHRPLAVMVVPR